MSKSRISLSALLLALVAVVLLAWRPAPDAAVDRIQREGTVTGWHIQSDGTVALRLEGTRDGKTFRLWFATPADRTATTRYEELVLDVVLATCGSRDPVVVISDRTNEVFGRSVADAMPLTAISRR